MKVDIFTYYVWGVGFGLNSRGLSYTCMASMVQFWALQDRILRDSGTCGMDLDFDNAFNGLCGTIPYFDVSSFTSKDFIPPKVQHVLTSALSSKRVQEMEVKFDMTTRQKAILGCLQATQAQDFLLVIPIDGLCQHMSFVEYRIILRYRFMIPLFLIDEVCHVCRKAYLDTFWEHVVHCKELPNFNYRHNFVRDVLFDIFRWAGVLVKKEAPMNFLIDPIDRRSILRLADVMV